MAAKNVEFTWFLESRPLVRLTDMISHDPGIPINVAVLDDPTQIANASG